MKLLFPTVSYSSLSDPALLCTHLIVGTPSPLLLKGWGGVGPSKIELLGGVQYFLLERGDKPVKGGEVDVEMGVCYFFIMLQFNHIYCVWGESNVPFVTFWLFSLLSQPYKILIQVFIELKPNNICTFLIHYHSVQKMLTALFNFVWNI